MYINEPPDQEKPQSKVLPKPLNPDKVMTTPDSI